MSNDKEVSTCAVSDIDPFSMEFLRNPHLYHAQLRDLGPVVYLPQYDIYVLARYAEVMHTNTCLHCTCATSHSRPADGRHSAMARHLA